MKRIATLLLLGVLVLHHQLSPADAVASLPNDASEYLAQMYARFRDVFYTRFRPRDRSTQFAFMVINRPETLQPCPLNMNVLNDDPGENYVAFTTRELTQGVITHAEAQALQNLPYYVEVNNPNEVYLFTYLSPCRTCADLIANAAQANPQITFYVGYIDDYSATSFSDQVHILQTLGGLNNVHYDRIAEPPATTCSRHRDQFCKRSTCPVWCPTVSGGGGVRHFDAYQLYLVAAVALSLFPGGLELW